ncbi:nucleotidyltransferase [Mycobacterium phage ScoobyDoobyDoo]|nr:nucleotidyltransferase [Mycobacterium phage ScoobyDoobyDoo]
MTATTIPQTHAVNVFDYIDPPTPDTVDRHRTRWHYEVARRHTIMLSRTGSALYGTSLENTDLDYQGVCIEPPEVALGVATRVVRTFEQFQYSTAPVGTKTPPGGIDLTVYGFGKFIQLCAKGDPNMIGLLFAPRSLMGIHTEFWDIVTSQSNLFLSRKAGERYLNYLRNQVAKYLTHDQSPRPELVARYGWDTKAGHHALRIAIQGRQLMGMGFLKQPMFESDRQLLLDIRQGHYSKDQVLDMVKGVSRDLERISCESPLAEDVDFDQLNTWVANMYRAWWSHNDHKSLLHPMPL